jgi:hypothetical protein
LAAFARFSSQYVEIIDDCVSADAGMARATFRPMRPWSARRALLLSGLVALGCYAPTLPLPPPQKPDITLTESGRFRLRGGIIPEAQIFALNERTGTIGGQQVGRSGLYDFELEAARGGDLMQLWYQAGTDLSPTTVFTLPDDLGEGGEGGASGASGAGP